MTKRFLGWQPDLPDQRDHIYSVPQAAGQLATALPPKVDLRPYCSPVEDQGELGSCTGNSIVGAMEFLEDKTKVLVFEDLSRLFVYYNERVIEGTVNQDSGAQIRDGIKSLANLGVCEEKRYPYDVTKFKRKPTKTAYANAAKRKITSYERITTFDDMKHCLASGYPFVFGFTVYSSFMSDAVAQTGKMPMPKKSEQVEGGHAVLAVGYDDDMQCVIVRNSWGTGWGDKGYFYMPYAYIQNSNLCDDMWKIIK